MKKMILSMAITAVFGMNGSAQNVGIGTTTPDASAILELNTTNKGFLPPQMNAVQKAAISNPKKGLMIYQTDGVPGLYIFDGIAWIASSGTAGNAWSLNGNAGSLPALNFIGTTDNQSLKFRVNNIPSGELNPLNVNVAFGMYALAGNVSGSQNIAIGYNSLNKNITGSDNAAFGTASLFENLNGRQNVALGTASLVLNKSGNNNVATGYYSLYSNVTGYSNVALGMSSLYKNVSGVYNVAVGDSALFNNLTGGSTAMGSKALYANTSGFHNTAIGFQALYANSTGGENTATGFGALTVNNGASNTANGYNALGGNSTGNFNSAYGSYALIQNAIGNDNTAVGYASLIQNINGNKNIAIGSHTLAYNVSANDNIGIGDSALFTNTDSRNIAIGSKAMLSHVSGDFNTAIGTNALRDDNNGYNNTAIGDQALIRNNSGYKNTAVGAITMLNNTSGYRNAAFGNGALLNNTAGFQNTAIGDGAMQNIMTGTNNTAIGYLANVGSNFSTNATAIGANAATFCNNCMVLGSTNGVNSDGAATFNINVGIGTQRPQTDLHINPNAAGSILIGTDRASGGYTNLEMGISQQSGGYSYIQSTQASGSIYGNLALNQSGGNVGIRIAAPLAPLHIKQSNETYPVNGGGLRIERQTNTSHWDIGADAGDDLDFTFNGVTKTYLNNTSGGFTITSDLRLKKDVMLMGTVLPMVLQLQAKTYHYRDNKADAKLSYGFIAQDVEKLFPDFVSTKGEEGIKAIAYQNFTVVAIKAIQEQQLQIELLKKENEILKQDQQKLMLQFEARLKVLERL